LSGRESLHQFDRPVVRNLRRVCLSLPETSETNSWGHPNFRAGKRVFAAFEMVKGRPSIAVRLDPVDVQRLLARREFFATPYGRGRWVSLWADERLDWKFVTELVHRSYRTVANKRMVRLLDAMTSSDDAIKHVVMAIK
jgi:predicted DNA-binding protein (MmcQ/YjbR family)